MLKHAVHRNMEYIEVKDAVANTSSPATWEKDPNVTYRLYCKNIFVTTKL